MIWGFGNPGGPGVWFRVPKDGSRELRRGKVVQALRSHLGSKESRQNC